MMANQAEEISSDEELLTSTLHPETKKVDIIDLTTAYHTTELVDLTKDSTTPKCRQRRRPGTRTKEQPKRGAAEINIELSDRESDEEELPHVLPDFPSRRGKAKAAKAAQESQPPGTVSILCPICFDHYDKILNTDRRLMSTKCGHVFCSECIHGALKSAKTCPTCRKKLTWNQLHPLYL